MNFLEAMKKEISDKIDKVETKIDTVQKELNRFRGESNERYIREEMVRRFGDDYCRPFNIQGLSGLARLVQPSKATLCTIATIDSTHFN